MTAELELEFTEIVGTVPITAVDQKGNVLASFRPPIEKEMGPISDLDLSSLIWKQLEQIPETQDKTAVFGFIRFDVAAPELVILDLVEKQVEVLRPPLGMQGPGWTGRLLSSPDTTRRGGSVGVIPPASDLRPDADPETLALITETALDEISEAMLEKTAKHAANADNVTQLPDAVLYDGEPYWVYCSSTFPDDFGTLEEAVQAAAEIAQTLPSALSTVRFRHKNNIYILALFSNSQGQIGRLTKTKFLRPGELAPARSFDAAKYLSS